MPMIVPFDGYVETLGKVSSTCLVTFDGIATRCPCELVGQMVSIRIYPERIDLVAHDAVVASHAAQFRPDQTRYDWQHYIPLIERKPGALRNGAPFADMPAPMQRCAACCSSAKGVTGSWPRCWPPCPSHGLEGGSGCRGTGAGIGQSERRAYRERAQPAQGGAAAGSGRVPSDGQRDAIAPIPAATTACVRR
jgi:hypothetical protein